MPGKVDNANQTAAIARVSEMASHAPVLIGHLHQILESSEFKGSRRSQEFLRHIVQNALEGNFDSLKERTIGMELFSREATYDTGVDSIVRVSASDVRKRLHQFYTKDGTGSEFQIDLPSGSYIPWFRQLRSGEPEAVGKVTTLAIPEVVAVTQALVVPISETPEIRQERPSGVHWITIAACMIAIVSLGLASYFEYQNRNLRSAVIESSPLRVMPWSALLEKAHRLNIVVSDTGYSSIQDLLGVTIPLADYVSFRYPEANRSPEVLRVAKFLSQKQLTAVVDVGITTRISELAQAAGTPINVRSARGLHVQDFKNDDNFVLLGSVRANPWTMLFDHQLDFGAEYVPALNKLIFRNRNPRANEPTMYVPSAAFGQTGDSYATLSFVDNPNQSGSVLLIAGTSAEGTEMAGKLVTNVELFEQTLRKAGIAPTAPPRRFQLLLRLSTMAGSVGGFEVIAFHTSDKRTR